MERARQKQQKQKPQFRQKARRKKVIHPKVQRGLRQRHPPGHRRAVLLHPRQDDQIRQKRPGRFRKQKQIPLGLCLASHVEIPGEVYHFGDRGQLDFDGH